MAPLGREEPKVLFSTFMMPDITTSNFLFYIESDEGGGRLDLA